MCPVYRCPNDDVVFQTSKIERVPTMQGHPECPGPVCREKFGAKTAAGAKVVPAPTSPQPLPAAATQDFSEAETASVPANAGTIMAPPIGQGW